MFKSRSRSSHWWHQINWKHWTKLKFQILRRKAASWKKAFLAFFPQEMLRSRISKHIFLLSKIVTSLFWSIICSFSCINNKFFEKQKLFLKPFLLFLLCGQQILVRSGLIHQSGSKAGHQGRWAETEVNPGMRDHHCHLFFNTNKLDTKYHKRRETQCWETGQP